MAFEQTMDKSRAVSLIKKVRRVIHSSIMRIRIQQVPTTTTKTMKEKQTSQCKARIRWTMVKVSAMETRMPFREVP